MAFCPARRMGVPPSEQPLSRAGGRPSLRWYISRLRAAVRRTTSGAAPAAGAEEATSPENTSTVHGGGHSTPHGTGTATAPHPPRVTPVTDTDPGGEGPATPRLPAATLDAGSREARKKSCRANSSALGRTGCLSRRAQPGRSPPAGPLTLGASGAIRAWPTPS